MPTIHHDRLSILEQDEVFYRDQSLDATDPHVYREAILGLGLTHLRMEPRKWRNAATEIWTAMHGQDLVHNLGTVGLVLGYVAGGAFDEASYEHANTLRARHYSSLSDT